QQWAVGHFM
uniref:Litorin n=1 Tax=Ranoidea aurea TaxID=8371 RepID=LITO_RANAE|nr:RecName: Full=Litorin [Ranoidea aurea]